MSAEVCIINNILLFILSDSVSFLWLLRITTTSVWWLNIYFTYCCVKYRCSLLLLNREKGFLFLSFDMLRTMMMNMKEQSGICFVQRTVKE